MAVDQNKVGEYSNRFLEIVDSASEVSRGDLQAMVEGLVLSILSESSN